MPSAFSSAHGFRIYFIPLPGCFSPFPHGTCSLSVARSYLALGGGPPAFGQDLTCPGLLWVPAVRKVPMGTGASPSMPRRSSRFPSNFPSYAGPNPSLRWFGLFRFRSPLLTESISLSFPPGTLMFQFPGLPSVPYEFRYG